MTDKATQRKTAIVVIIIGILLVVTGFYQMANPVLSTSQPTPRDTSAQFLATTTFVVSTGYNDCSELGMPLLQDYDTNRNSLIDDGELSLAAYDLAMGTITQNQYDQLEYAWVNCCPVDLPPEPEGRIDDDTDTLSFDKLSYGPSETVHMTAIGSNIGDGVWNGKVTFTVTHPNGNTYITVENDPVTVESFGTGWIANSFDLPPTDATGTWTVQSKWIHESGDVHAYSFMELGTEEIFGMDIDVFGAMLVLLGILLLIGGFMMRGKK